MAYAFEKIMNQIGDNDKANIFGGEPGQQNGGQQQNFAAGTGGQTKTTTDGDVSSGGGAGGSVQKSSFVAQSPQNTGAQRAYEAAKAQPSGSFAPMSQVSEKLGKAQTDLQDEANAYVKAGKDKQVYSIPNADIEKAISGDETARGAVSKTLSQTLPAPIEKFEPKTDYNLEEIETFKSTPGVARYLRSEYGPGYTAGQAMFDTGRLQSSPEYYNTLRSLEGRQQDLTKQAKALGAADTGVEAQVRKAGEENLTTAQKAIKKFLEDQQGALTTANQGELTTYLSDLEKLKGNPNAVGQTSLASSDASKRIQQVIKERPDLAKYLTPEVMATFGIDPGKFVNFADTTGLTADSFYNADEAKRFNSIMSLLGTGGAAKAAGILPASQSSFDTEKYLGNVFGAAEAKNTAADEAARAKIKSIEDKLAGLLNSQNTVPSANTYAIPEFWNAAKVAGYQGDFDPTLVDPNQYFKVDPVTGNPFEYATDQDAQELNAAYEELMNPTRVQAGARMGRPNFQWDSTGYKDAVMAALAARMRGEPAAPQERVISPGPANRETSPQRVIEAAEQGLEDIGYGTFVPQYKKAAKEGSKIVGRWG